MGAFYSHCSNWDRPLYFFAVRIENDSSQPVALSLTDLFVVDADGGSHQPVDLSDLTSKPGAFIPASTNIAPQAAVTGGVAVDDSNDFVPVRFQFALGGEVLTVEFAGQPTILPGGTFTGE